MVLPLVCGVAGTSSPAALPGPPFAGVFVAALFLALALAFGSATISDGGASGPAVVVPWMVRAMTLPVTCRKVKVWRGGISIPNGGGTMMEPAVSNTKFRM